MAKIILFKLKGNKKPAVSEFMSQKLE